MTKKHSYLKQLRIDQGYTLTQVANATGISHPYLSQMETGKEKNPSIKVLYELSKLYCVTIDKLAYDFVEER